MRSLFVAMALAFFALQQAPPPQTPAALATGIVAGLVEGVVMTAGAIPEPLGGVQVQLNIAQAARAAGITPDNTVLDSTTDDKGHFVFKDLYPGRYQLRYSRDGYYPVPGDSPVKIEGAVNTQPVGARGRGAAAAAAQSTLQFELATKQPVTLSIPMIPGGVIAGRVMDANGKIIIGGQVSALRMEYPDGHRTLASSKTSTTNDRGEYRLFGLEPGEYYVSADYRRTTFNATGTSQDSFRAFFPGTPDTDRALKVAVQSGTESSGTNFTIQTSSTVKIAGMIQNMIPSMVPAAVTTTTAAQPVVLPSFYLVPNEGNAIRDNISTAQNAISAAADRAQGKFEIRNVRPGNYELYAMVRETVNNSQTQHVGHTTVNVGNQDVNGVTVIIRPVGEVRVRFTTNGDAAIQRQIPTALQMRSRAMMNGTQNVPQVAPPQGKADDWHVYSPPMEGEYILDSQLTSLRDAYVADIRQGDKSIYETGTIVVGSGVADTVEVVLARPAASISGTVQNAATKPVVGIPVMLIPNGERRGNRLLYKRVTTDMDGKFNMTAVAPGGYKLFAWEDIPNNAELNAEFMKDAEDRGTPITIEVGATLTVQLPLIPSKN